MNDRPAGVLVVMAKAPRPGWVKTRMSPPLSPEQAADFYACMLDDVLEASAVHAAALGLEPVVAAHPPGSLAEFAERVPPAFRIEAQRGAGLGARMHFAMRGAFAAGAECVVLRGSDNPALSLDHVREALELMRQHDLVLTPDRDGGYGLVGARRPVASVFDLPMSTSSLLEDTLAAAQADGLDVGLGTPCFDLDSADDLGVLDAWRASVGDPSSCRRTLEWVDAAPGDLLPRRDGEA